MMYLGRIGDRAISAIGIECEVALSLAAILSVLITPSVLRSVPMTDTIAGPSTSAYGAEARLHSRLQ
jgi:hypothetical protein